ncbi:MAG: helix-turn-helix domain-containing protein [Bryobacteraceae bacterium]
MQLPNAIKELRGTLGVSQQKFAGKANVSLPTIQRWEGGSTQPTPATLARLYSIAAEAGRHDLAGVFAQAHTAVLDAAAGALVLEFLPSIQETIARAAAKLTQSLAAPGLTNADRGKLIGEALGILTDGQQLISRILRETKGAAVSAPRFGRTRTDPGPLQ